MPWKVTKRKNKYCVTNAETGATVHCHETEKKAQKQVAALYANTTETLKAAHMAPTLKRVLRLATDVTANRQPTTGSWTTDVPKPDEAPKPNLTIIRRNDMFCVVNEDTGMTVRCHPSRDGAEQTMRMILGPGDLRLTSSMPHGKDGKFVTPAGARGGKTAKSSGPRIVSRPRAHLFKQGSHASVSDGASTKGHIVAHKDGSYTAAYRDRHGNDKLKRFPSLGKKLGDLAQNSQDASDFVLDHGHGPVTGAPKPKRPKRRREHISYYD